jgi:hypothetical protein
MRVHNRTALSLKYLNRSSYGGSIFPGNLAGLAHAPDSYQGMTSVVPYVLTIRSASAAGVAFLFPDAVFPQLAKGGLKAVVLCQTEARHG